MPDKKFYVTTSIAYTNAPPHIGYALELVQADVLARFHKLSGDDVFFLTGTDEHGIKVERKAKEEGKTPEKFTDELSGKFKELTKVLNISNDDFIRTTDKKKHWPTVEKFWLKLKEKGDIEKRSYKGFYCVGCEAFVKEKDLVDGKCAIHQKTPEEVVEENWFFKLSKYADKIKEAILKDELRVIPEGKKNEMLSFIEQGLEDVSFSRPKEKLSWGIPVPQEDSQTIYVWADALVNYISALDYPDGEKYKKFWPANVHCVGKDILRFHAVIWAGMLLALELPLPKNIFVHGFITSGGQKMSKSLGNVIDPFELIKKYGADPLRYFLLREIPPSEDGDFTEDKFQERYNADLAGGIGNLAARVITLADKFQIQSASWRTKSQTNPKLEIQINKAKEECEKSLEEFKFSEALGAIWELISFCDKYVNDEKPWSLDATQDKDKLQEVIGSLLSAVSEIAGLLDPFLPETSEKILKQLEVNKSHPLFPRI